MKMDSFKLEEFWKKYEFSAPYLLCCSDTETWSLQELLALADVECQQLWQTLTLGYTETLGLPLLRKEIAHLYSSLSTDHIITLAGAEEGIYCSMRALIKPGDHVIIVAPCYQSLAALPKACGAEVTVITISYEKQWELDVEEVRKAFKPNTRLLVLNYPHNPTGKVLESHILKELAAVARQHGSYIFCDEVYRDLKLDQAQQALAIADIYEKGISLNVLSKSFGLAGLRMGWLATHDRHFLREVSSYKLYTSICNSAPSEVLALIALRAIDPILKRNQEIALKNLRLLDAFVQCNQTAISWVRPQGGSIAVLKLLWPISVEAFAEGLLRKEGVLIMPGSVFDLPDNFFRIGFGRKNMPSILAKLQSYLKEQASTF